jgi:hypothetical protein
MRQTLYGLSTSPASVADILDRDMGLDGERILIRHDVQDLLAALDGAPDRNTFSPATRPVYGARISIRLSTARAFIAFMNFVNKFLAANHKIQMLTQIARLAIRSEVDHEQSIKDQALMNVQRGDRVRLAPNLADGLMKDHAKGGRKVDWLARRGVVIRVCAPADSVTVKWDDRVTLDLWPARALKKAL